MAQVIKMDRMGKVKPAVMIGTGGASIIIPADEIVSTAEKMLAVYLEIKGV